VLTDFCGRRNEGHRIATPGNGRHKFFRNTDDQIKDLYRRSSQFTGRAGAATVWNLSSPSINLNLEKKMM
jgi:hypothetical protein